MIHLETQSDRSPAEILTAAEQFFGQEGWGLTLRQRSRTQIFLVGGGGSVSVSANRIAPGQPTTVQVQAKEWEQPAREFLAQMQANRTKSMLRRWLDKLRRLA